jgi:hypothetical protein
MSPAKVSGLVLHNFFTLTKVTPVIVGDVEASLGELWFTLGLVSMGAFTVLIFVSIRPIRERAYEFFVYTHIALAA